MMDGMEEYFYKEAGFMSYGAPKTPVAQIFLAVLGEDSMNHRIFKHNLDIKIDDFASNNAGLKPHERTNEAADEAKA